jgi:hypothetical protein
MFIKINKFKILILFGLTLIFYQCGSQRNNYTYQNLITGKWKAYRLGNVVVQLGLSLPVYYTFKSNGIFKSILTIQGIQKSFTGKYKINSNADPKTIYIKRNSGRIFHGIIKFITKNKFIMVLYDKRVLPLPSYFGKNDVQEFTRID